MHVKYQVDENKTLDVEVDKLTQAFEFFAYCDAVFGVCKCGHCGAPKDRLRLDHRTPKGYNYYQIKCMECGHELKFGQVKDTGRLFQKGWEEPYQGGSADDESQETVGAGSTESEDIPF